MISKRDAKFIQLASREASLSPCLMRHGAVATMNGKLVGKGYNHHRSQSKDGFIHDCVTCHAEIAALRQANKRNINFKKVTLYVCRVDNSGALQDSAPCFHCMDTIRLLNIKRVVYSGENSEIIACKPQTHFTDHVSCGNRFRHSTGNAIIIK
jgi:deoxycytidylate deaminase